MNKFPFLKGLRYPTSKTQFIIVFSEVSCQWMLLRVTMSNFSRKRLLEMMDDGQVNTLSQGADRYEKEIFSDDGLDLDC